MFGLINGACLPILTKGLLQRRELIKDIVLRLATAHPAPREDAAPPSKAPPPVTNGAKGPASGAIGAVMAAPAAAPGPKATMPPAVGRAERVATRTKAPAPLILCGGLSSL